jgi:hypothetical protein
MLDMQGIFIDIRIHGDSLDPEFLAGAHNSDGDLAAVGDQNLFEHIHKNSCTQSNQAMVFNSEPLDLAAVLFSKAGKIEYIA